MGYRPPETTILEAFPELGPAYARAAQVADNEPGSAILLEDLAELISCRQVGGAVLRCAGLLDVLCAEVDRVAGTTGDNGNDVADWNPERRGTGGTEGLLEDELTEHDRFEAAEGLDRLEDLEELIAWSFFENLSDSALRDLEPHLARRARGILVSWRDG